MIPVLFTTYNRLYFTEQSLPALLENTPEGDIYIFDNNSSDKTKEYLNKFGNHPRVKEIFFNEKNEGVSGSMNKFFELTRGYEWIAKVDNDTVVPKGWLTKLKNIAVNFGYDLIQASHYFCILGYKDWNDFLKENESIVVDDGNIVPFAYVGGSGVIIRRAAINDTVRAVGNIYGWSIFQKKHDYLKKAFYDGVFIKILDMEYYNRYRSDIDIKYYIATGRIGSMDFFSG